MVVATNKSLETMVQDGAFPDDLYGRLFAIHVKLPPLRERLEDIPLIFDFVLEAKVREAGGTWPKTIAPGVYAALERDTWEQNVRRLEQVAGWVASMRAESSRVDAEDLLGSLRPAQAQKDASAASQVPSGKSSENCNPFSSALHSALAHVAVPADHAKLWGCIEELRVAERGMVLRLVRAAIAECTNRSTGIVNKTAVAECLFGREMDTTTAKRKLRELNDLYLLDDGSEPAGELIKWIAVTRKSSTES